MSWPSLLQDTGAAPVGSSGRAAARGLLYTLLLRTRALAPRASRPRSAAAGSCGSCMLSSERPFAGHYPCPLASGERCESWQRTWDADSVFLQISVEGSCWGLAWRELPGTWWKRSKQGPRSVLAAQVQGMMDRQASTHSNSTGRSSWWRTQCFLGAWHFLGILQASHNPVRLVVIQIRKQKRYRSRVKSHRE